jgi:DeoR family transcriptional regulator, fructose operon transcriptional repressor
MSSPNARRSYILKQIENLGSVTVADLADDLGVSGMTIRRDLDELEKDGLVQRVHGSAVSARGRGYEPPYALRVTQAIEAKQAIGVLAATLVADGDSIALDIGSTTIELAKNLTERHNLTILTPSLRIANLFINQPDVRLILPGGIARPGEASLSGDLTRKAFQGLFVDRLFLSVGGINAQFGLTGYNWDEALVKQAMIKSAKEVIVVADATKFGKVAFAHITSFSAIHKLVTDQMPPKPLLLELNKAGVNISLANISAETK